MTVGAFFIPVANMEEWTDSYNLYKELKDYKKISELEEHLDSKHIKYEKEDSNIYIYLNENNKYADVSFVTIDTECKIETEKYDVNFQKLDARENVKIYQKDGKEYISHTDDGIKYTYSAGRYYVTWVRVFWLRIMLIIIGFIATMFWLWLGFCPKHKK